MAREAVPAALLLLGLVLAAPIGLHDLHRQPMTFVLSTSPYVRRGAPPELALQVTGPIDTLSFTDADTMTRFLRHLNREFRQHRGHVRYGSGLNRSERQIRLTAKTRAWSWTLVVQVVSEDKWDRGAGNEVRFSASYMFGDTLQRGQHRSSVHARASIQKRWDRIVNDAMEIQRFKDKVTRN